jgi:hypothetical protein
MAVVVSSALTISDTLSGGGVINANNPIIGYQNLVTTSNIESDTEELAFPVTNLANPSTNLKWVGEDSSPAEDEYITLTLNTVEEIDYIGVAKHNWGSAQITVSIEIFDTDASPEAWVEVIGETLLATDSPAIFRFTPQAVGQIRLRLQPGTAVPEAAVVYAGKLLILQRRIYVGHAPINMNRGTKVVNARSESGNFLGRIILNQMTKTSVNLINLTPSWYRTYMEPFIQASIEDPFFFAWRPSDYPREVGYAWMTNDPVPSNALANGYMQVTLEMSGVV